MDKKPSTRQEILVLLKKSGGLTVDDLAKSLQITPMGVRQHLASLESDNLVQTTQVRHKVGRPSFLYRLSETAEASFPKDYINLLKFLLAELEKMDGPDKVPELFRRYAALLKIEWQNRLHGADLAGRLPILNELLTEAGNMPELTHTGQGLYSLTLHNCRIADLTKANRGLCLHDHIMPDCLGNADITKRECIANGDHFCRYVIVPKPPS